LETLRVETDSNQVEDSIGPASISYILKEGEQMAQIWNAQDRAEYEQSVREILERMVGLRQGFEPLRAQTDAIWERFSTLALERVFSRQLREFLEGIEAELQDLDLRLVGTDCEVDRLRTRIQERRRVLEEKIAVLEPLAHRTSTQSHISMMLSRVAGLEAHLLGKKDMALEDGEAEDTRHPTAPGDLLYLRIRLLTTRIAIIASNRSKHLSELDAGLATLLPEVERIRTDTTTLLTRIECVKDLSRYWLAYLDITQGETG
jgi:DNA repair exonuclease SbcCD ATPase subunit